MIFCEECGSMVSISSVNRTKEDNTIFEITHYDCRSCGISGINRKPLEYEIPEEGEDPVGRGVSDRDDGHPLEGDTDE